MILGVAAILLTVVLTGFVKSPLFEGLKDSITGKVVESDERQLEDANSDAVAIKNIKILTDMYSENFQIPVDNLDLTIEAQKVDIIMLSADITLTLEEPMVFESFTGTINWRNSMFTLEGQLQKYLTDLIEINWKTHEDVKIRVKEGSVSISQINIASFGSVVSGEIKLAEKVTINPNKDLVTMNEFRGSVTSVVEDIQTKLIFDGYIDTIFVDSEEFELNIN